MSWSISSAVIADLGKNSFHLVGQDERGAIVLRIKLSRSQLPRRLANIPPCLSGRRQMYGITDPLRRRGAVSPALGGIGSGVSRPHAP